MKAKCYFSYSWDNSNKFGVFEYLKNEIERKSNERIEVILDRKSFDVGEDFEEREKQILACDSVVMFFTPEYKSVLNRMDHNRGVFREYGYVKKLLVSNPRVLIPVLFNGTVEESIPLEFTTKIAGDLVNAVFLESKNKKVCPPNAKSRPIVNNFTSTIVARTESNYEVKDYPYRDVGEKIYQMLYVTHANERLPKECMIKMDPYDEIINQHSCLVIGRKGSGKSTLFEILKKMNPELFEEKYKVLCPINAEFIETYTLFGAIEQFRSDELYVNMDKILCLFWQSYFAFYSMYIICLEEEHHRILDERQAIFRRVSYKIKNRLQVKILDTDQVRSSLFTLVVDELSRYASTDVIDHASYESFIPSIIANLTVENILLNFLGQRLYNQYMFAIRKCKKRILIALDGFDTKSDSFRAEANTLYQNPIPEKQDIGFRMIKFEKLFYRNLVYTIDMIKKNHIHLSNSPIFDLVDFCIVLPQDRLDQIETVDRDFSKKQICCLFWDAYELLNMILLRLEYIKGVKQGITLDIQERFHQVMLHIPGISDVIKITIDGREREIDIFSYILRHSFWRPRDILIHFAQLLRLSDDAVQENIRVVDNDIIKNILAKSANKIIEDEFIKEYDKVFINLREVLHSFDHMDLINSLSEVCDILVRTRFTTTYSYDTEKIESKVLILYQLGIIGLYYEEKEARKCGFGNKICFNFNEGLGPINSVLEHFNQSSCEAQFIFNPIFTKFLRLHINTPELIGDFGWDYYLKNHQLRNVIQRI